ncbi:hypothetical protein AB1I65_12730 [Clostridium butyricum]
MLGGTIESMLTAEMDNYLRYNSYECTDSSNARNVKKDYIQ